jgi:hypothetical protein
MAVAPPHGPQVTRIVPPEVRLVNEQFTYYHRGRPQMGIQLSWYEGRRDFGFLRCIGDWHGAQHETSFRAGFFSRPRPGCLEVQFRYKEPVGWMVKRSLQWSDTMQCYVNEWVQMFPVRPSREYWQWMRDRPAPARVPRPLPPAGLPCAAPRRACPPLLPLPENELPQPQKPFPHGSTPPIPPQHVPLPPNACYSDDDREWAFVAGHVLEPDVDGFIHNA